MKNNEILFGPLNRLVQTPWRVQREHRESKKIKKDVGSLMYKLTPAVLGDPQLMVTGHL